MNINEKMISMEIGDIEFFQYDFPEDRKSIFHAAMRVPGGWIFSQSNECGCNASFSSSVFVPENSIVRQKLLNFIEERRKYHNKFVILSQEDVDDKRQIMEELAEFEKLINIVL